MGCWHVENGFGESCAPMWSLSRPPNVALARVWSWLRDFQGSMQEVTASLGLSLEWCCRSRGLPPQIHGGPWVWGLVADAIWADMFQHNWLGGSVLCLLFGPVFRLLGWSSRARFGACVWSWRSCSQEHRHQADECVWPVWGHRACSVSSQVLNFPLL